MSAEAKTGNDFAFIRLICPNLVAEFSNVLRGVRECVVVTNEAKNIHFKPLLDGAKRIFIYSNAPKFDTALGSEDGSKWLMLGISAENIDRIEQIIPSKVARYKHTASHSPCQFCRTCRANRVFHIFSRCIPAVFNVRNKPPSFELFARLSGYLAQAYWSIETRHSNECALNRREGFAVNLIAFCHSGPLPVADYHSAYRTDRSNKCKKCGQIFKPVLAALFGVVVMGIGFWLMFFTVRRYGLRLWRGGAALILSGATLYVVGGIGIGCHLTENASFGPSVGGTSAACYGSTKGIQACLIPT